MPEVKDDAIEVVGVSKRFGPVVALDNVSFSVKAGEMFFLLGPSGCGKTTLLRILAGLETLDSGTIRFAGKDVMSLPPHQRGAPMVFQNYALWPHLNVRENVAFGLVERRLSQQEIGTKIADVLHLVDLAGLEHRMPAQLSGGQQQRVVLARALVLNPRIILLDEPLSNLDAKLRLEMRDEIAKLHSRTDITFVYVTHDQTEALSLADRMVVLSAGKISALGAPSDLYHRPPNEFCANFLGEANMIAGRVMKIDGDVVTVETAFGAWKAVNASGALQLNSEVRCLVRPENLQPAADAKSGANSFEAEVKFVRMNGSTLTVGLEVKGESAKSTLLNRTGIDLQPGQKLRWAVEPAATIIIRQ
jgi:iron(III) transport system ATP-binding protein